MKHDIRQRLEKLESQVPWQPTELHKEMLRLHRFLQLAVAYYVGDPTPEESIVAAYARALGYHPRSLEFRMAWDANDEDFNRRESEAIDKLLAKFGVNPNDTWDEDKSERVADAFMIMEAGFSEHYRQYWRDFQKGSS